MSDKGLPDEMQLLAGTGVVKVAEPTAIDSVHHRIRRALETLTRLNSGRDTRNVHQRLCAYRKHSEALMDVYDFHVEQIWVLQQEIRQMRGATPDQAGRRWTNDQDDALVEMACRDESSMMSLALNFNRTPAAISSRLTYLVGVSKVSRHVVGRITGYLDGVAVNGVFDGELRPHEHVPTP